MNARTPQVTFAMILALTLSFSLTPIAHASSPESLDELAEDSEWEALSDEMISLESLDPQSLEAESAWESFQNDSSQQSKQQQSKQKDERFQGPVRASKYGTPKGAKLKKGEQRDIFAGRKTSCGTKMNPSALTFAHRWVGITEGKGKNRKRKMKCGQVVCFKYGNRMVEGRADDAGPYVSKRTFDLSYALYSALRYSTDENNLFYKFGPCPQD